MGPCLLDINWPRRLDGQALELDMLLATATEVASPLPTPEQVAKAWIAQRGGHERYFFENVRHGIRTPEDLAIWRCIVQQRPPRPPWPNRPNWRSRYAEPADILVREGAAE